jgi:aminopeptidase-like protein
VTPHGEYPEYHTSADDLGFVRPHFLADSLRLYLAVHDVLENDAPTGTSTQDGAPTGQARALPFRRRAGSGIRTNGTTMGPHLSDDRHALLDIADRSRLPPFET